MLRRRWRWRRRRMIELAALLLLIASGVAAAAAADNEGFVLAGFRSDSVTTSGVAVVTSTGLLQLTNDTKERYGHGFIPAPVRFRNATTGAPVSFSTTFVVAVVPRYPDAHGHGLAFALAPSVAVPGAVAGKNLGLFNLSDNEGKGRSQIVAVELDTAMDEEFFDVDDNHVGVDVNSLRSVNSTPTAYYNGVGTAGRFVSFNLSAGAPLQVWIEYDGESTRLEVTVSPAGATRPSVPLVSCNVNLSSAVSQDTYVGFSAANGAAASSHYVLGWSFRLGGGRPQDLDLSKLPPLPSSKSNSSKRRTPLMLLLAILLLAVVVVLLASAAVAVLVVRRRRFAEEEEDWEREHYGPHRISYKDLHRATKGFHDLIGVGGVGRVYRGVLPRSGTEVAVKKVSHDSRQGLQEFVSEIASMSRLRHRNLMQLLGYCRRRGELVLVYDYMVNGSLDQHLFINAGNQSSELSLSWEQRAKIVRGVAAGLLYLHEGWEQVVVHRDIKASNVLLDADMNGKLSDFGLVRRYDHGSNPQTTRVVGTIGYIAPEMSKTGKATMSTDVFAFGALLLKVACGRRPMVFSSDSDSPGLVELVLEHWKSGSIKDARDPRIGKCDEDDVELVLKLGLLCSHPDPLRRPDMRQVVQILEGAAPAPEELPEDLGSSGWIYGYAESFDQFVTLVPSTCELTVVATQPSSSHSTDDQQQHILS